jgi:hypothetical protein
MHEPPGFDAGRKSTDHGDMERPKINESTITDFIAERNRGQFEQIASST